MDYQPTENELKLTEYLESIGGLENGFYLDKPPITSYGYFCVRDGWIPLVHNLIVELIDAGWNKQICQVKEKFGGLRFYINEADDNVWNIIEKYESLSYETCEVCGDKGELRRGGWLQTLCDKHYEETNDKLHTHL